MKKIVTAIMVLGLAAFVMTGFAQEKKNKKRGGNDPTAGVVKKAMDEGLPEDAIAKIKAAAAEHGPKIRDAQAKVDSILTDDQKKARNEAKKAAKAAGKKGKEAKADEDAALKLTPDQQKQMTEAEAKRDEALAAFRKAAGDQLTDEQKAKIGLGGKGKKKKNK